MATESNSTKDHILDCGERLIAHKGFVGVGLSEILSAAGIPKGSFYHYFSSKERFGEVLLTRYIDAYLARLDALFKPDGTPARQRLMTYWSYWNTSQCDVGATSCASQDAGNKCLIVKLSAEVADISEAMRLTLRGGTDRVVSRIAQCLEDARADGSVALSLDAASTALTLYELWLGASLLAKLRRDASPFEHALVATEQVLGSRGR
ncbi:TetR/AcrR family transcriptional regulator [Rhodoferax sp. U11-2br]|uniref:TetR/AcrR family transcriptional regulator n=1 Tax=Rhodoferax sp. U11-2br TaxID=2838878 RepID=UPI001BEB9D77|nr:TetR/AcrR family transcriptional regulator [Rhodoferax sp. U11-2br]MBT3068983.1 TetR/AcrR family transcriptional regulator [Rhodoferax sp. U11-2br]